jgi:tetratricopeptide (TPR) repeat protein
MNSAQPGAADDNWQALNRHGLELATRGAWEEALRAFELALEGLKREAQPDHALDDERDADLAVLMSNLCQTTSRLERYDEAQRYAERSLALRVALYGESALSVARARSDLAVTLANRGRLNDALSLLQRAIASLEVHEAAGASHTPALTLLRENAKRVRNIAHTNDRAPSDSGGILDSFPEVVMQFDHAIDDEKSLDRVAFNLVEPPPTTLSAVPKKSTSGARANPLGFDVEYGIPREHHEPIQPQQPVDHDE